MLRRIPEQYAIAFLSFTISVSVSIREASGQCELQIVNASDGESGDYFGESVAISADFAAIGASGVFLDVQSGSVYLFERIDESSWTEHTRIDPDDDVGRSLFGASVDLVGNLLLVGAWRDGEHNSKAGSAYIYRYDGGTWREEAKLEASDAEGGNSFGYSVALAPSGLLIGAIGKGRTDRKTGAVYYFVQVNNAWRELSIVTASDANDYDRFGSAVSVDGPLMAVGAWNAGNSGPDAYDGRGAVYIFDLDHGGLWWNETDKLTASDQGVGAYFGASVSASGNRILIGAPGAFVAGKDSGTAYIYRRDEQQWVREGQLIPLDIPAPHDFGAAVSLRGDVALVHSPGADRSVGAVYVFRMEGTTWHQVAKLTPSDGVPLGRFGLGAAQYEGIVVAGDTRLDGPGAAYFFRLGGDPDCNANGIIDDCKPDSTCDIPAIPTLSHWGLLALGVMLLFVSRRYFFDSSAQTPHKSNSDSACGSD